MSYLRGCLIMLAVLAGCYYFEVRQLERLAIPHATVLAGGLALVVALFAGSLDELIAMHLRGSQSTRFNDKELVQVSGRLRPLGDLVQSPVSGRRVLMYEYFWRETGLSTGEYRQAAGMMRGVAMTPCELVTPQGAFRLEGFPNLEHFKEETLDAGTAAPGMEKLLQAKQWKSGSGNIIEAMKVIDTPMGIEGGTLTFLNGQAEADVGNGGLKRFRWVVTETVVVAGSEVTVKGTYRLNPARVHLGREGLNVSNELRPGSAEVVAGQNRTRQWIGVVVFAALVVVSHLFAYLWFSQILKMSSD